MMAAQPPGPYSPDGRFWWDGTAWRPVPGQQPPAMPFPPSQPQPGPRSQPQQPQAGPQPEPHFPPSGPVPHGPRWAGPQPVESRPFAPAPINGAPVFQPTPGAAPPPGGAPPRPAKTSFVPLVVGTAVAALVLGGLAGGVVGLVTTAPAGSATAPPFTERFPTGERQYLPGVTVALIADDWLTKTQGWNCVQDAKARDLFSRAKQRMECRPRGDAESEMFVSIEYDADDKVKVVSAACHAGTRSPLCRDLFAELAGTLLNSQPEFREQAEQWARRNTASEKATTIGGVRLETNLDPNGLRATPEG